MGLYATNGFPVGTICTIKDDARVVENLRGRECTITKGLHWNEQFQTEGYFITVNTDGSGKRWFGYPWMLTLKYLPVTLKNWADNKITLCLEFNETIFKDLSVEDNPYVSR